MKEDISGKSLVELKAMAYDMIATKELAEQNLATINSVISQKFREQQVVPPTLSAGEEEKEPSPEAEEKTEEPNPAQPVEEPPMEQPTE